MRKLNVNPFDIKVGTVIEYARRQDGRMKKIGQVQTVGASLVFVDCNGNYEDVHYDEIIRIVNQKY